MYVAAVVLLDMLFGVRVAFALDETRSAIEHRGTEANSSEAGATAGADLDAETGLRAETPAERERREQIRQQLRRAFAVLFVLCLLSVFVSVMFLLWTVRLRRRLRQPLPTVHKGDELWFLKPARPKSDENPSTAPSANPPPPADEPPEYPNAS